MCFAPLGVHWACTFSRSELQSGPNPMFLTFWLPNVLRATTPFTFSTSQLPKVVRHWGVLCNLTWKFASRHSSVQFFISHLASQHRIRRFSEPTFRPSGAPNHWKNSVSRLSHLFAHLHLLSSFSFSSTLLFFFICHIVGSLTSKLPSIIYCPINTFISHQIAFWRLPTSQNFSNGPEMIKFFQTANSPDKNIWLEVKPSLSRGKCLSGFSKSKDAMHGTSSGIYYISIHRQGVLVALLVCRWWFDSPLVRE